MSVYLIKKLNDNEYQIKDTTDGHIVCETETAESAEKICEDYCDNTWGWEGDDYE